MVMSMPEVLMPRLDAGMQSGKIVEWLKKEGDVVKKGEAVVVVEGEKTTFEIEAPEGGVLSKILVSAGTDVPVSQPVAIIGEASRNAQPTTVTPKPPEQTAATQPSSPRPTAPGERVPASPAARRLAQERGVDLAMVKGTGPGGRITSEDILAAATQAPDQTATTKQRQPAVLKRTKLQGIRKSVAERLSYSARNAVATTLTMEVDASKLVALKNTQGGISFTALLVKAVAKTLEKHQAVNSTIDGEEIITYSDVNVCVAINTDNGLVAPVIRNTNLKSAKVVDTEIRELAQKAGKNQLTIEELTGGTFTVTNLGAQDIDTFIPIINPPQCAILGVGRIANKAIVSGEKISARPTTVLTLVFDHRIVDGLPAAKVLRDIRRVIEEPEGLV
jgi:pyruvate dehydrogenase E2 component (dihydrolipoamide acetyltransferase)